LGVSLDIVKEDGVEALQGAIYDGTFVADLTADSVINAKNSLAGRYNTELLPPEGAMDDPAEIPSGAGVVGIRATGSLGSIIGSLADGTSVVTSAPLSAPLKAAAFEGETFLPMYVSLQGGRGMVIGWFTLNTDTNLSPAVLSSPIHWLKAPAPAR
jgi:hypothetical protein